MPNGFGLFEITDETKNTLQVLFRHIEQNEGRLVISQTSKGEWVIGYEFGKEAEDSDMAGGAAYGIGPSLTMALNQTVQDLR